MSPAQIAAYCLDKPGAVPDEPWDGDQVAKVGGKIFAFLGSTTLGLKCGRDRDDADELIERYPAEVSVMAYIGRYGWNTIRTDAAVPDEDLIDLIDASYSDVVARLPRSKRPGATR